MARNYKTVGPFICQNPHCEKSFMGYPGNVNRVCSKRCGRRKHPTKEIACKRCGNPFISGMLNRKRFCSIQCAQPPYRQNCARCKKEFISSPSHKRKFCSRMCHFIDRTKPIKERFWSKVQKTESCWLWIGTKNRYGYGTILHQGSRRLAHRLAYELSGNVIPQGMNLLHTCDNPPCINPEHLRVGTQLDNVRDMYEKGRGNKKRTGQITKRQWLEILNFYDHKCALCQSRSDLVKDHYVPIACEGTGNWENIWPLCSSCNWKKGGKSPEMRPLLHVDALREKLNSSQNSRNGKWIYWREARKRYEVQMLIPRVGNKYIGRYKTLNEAQVALATARQSGI